MRPFRLLAPYDPENGFSVLYHITSRVVEKRFIFGERERRRFLKLAKDYAAFSGFELVSWCVMSNHFHLLVRVPVQDVEGVPDEQIMERLARILSPSRLEKLQARIKSTADPEERRGILSGFRKRIGHLPSYVKAVKQEFSQWFNFANEREGTLWEGRYHSTIIEDTGGGNPEDALNGAGEIARIVASYIDMNPVRAKVEADPKDSDWSSYGAALRGDETALRGLRILWGDAEGGRNQETTSPGPGSPDKHYLALHRHRLMRSGEIGDLIETSTHAPSMPGESNTKNRGRPPRLAVLRRLRALGSPKFLTNIGV